MFMNNFFLKYKKLFKYFDMQIEKYKTIKLNQKSDMDYVCITEYLIFLFVFVFHFYQIHIAQTYFLLKLE